MKTMKRNNGFNNWLHCLCIFLGKLPGTESIRNEIDFSKPTEIEELLNQYARTSAFFYFQVRASFLQVCICCSMVITLLLSVEDAGVLRYFKASSFKWRKLLVEFLHDKKWIIMSSEQWKVKIFLPIFTTMYFLACLLWDIWTLLVVFTRGYFIS